MIKKMYKCDVTCSLPPPPVANCHTFSDPLPLERDVLYGQPPTRSTRSSSCLTLSRPPVTSHIMFFNRAIGYPSLHHVFGLTYHQKYTHHFFVSTTVIANHKTSSSSGSSIRHPRAFHLKLKCHLFKHSYVP